MSETAIPGYRMGDSSLPASTVTAKDFANLKSVLLLGEADIALLREARAIVGPHVEELLDVWYGFVGSHDFLLASFSTPAGPDGDYLARVRMRFGQWVRDILAADFSPEWLAYQAEVGRRHVVTKNETDGVHGAPPVVPFQFMIALIYPIYATIRPFLDSGARDAAHAEAMHQAWLKAVLLNMALWSQAYVQEGWF